MDDGDAPLAEWAVDQQASRRSRERLIRQVRAQTTDLASVMRHISGRRDRVVLLLRDGASLPGTVTAVGSDFICLDRATYIPLQAIASITTRLRQAAGHDHRVLAEPAPTFAATLARLAEDGPNVRVVLDGGHTVIGELHHTGEDVARVGDSYVAIAAIAALTLV